MTSFPWQFNRLLTRWGRRDVGQQDFLFLIYKSDLFGTVSMLLPVFYEELTSLTFHLLFKKACQFFMVKFSKISFHFHKQIFQISVLAELRGEKRRKHFSAIPSKQTHANSPLYIMRKTSQWTIAVFDAAFINIGSYKRSPKLNYQSAILGNPSYIVIPTKDKRKKKRYTFYRLEIFVLIERLNNLWVNILISMIFNNFTFKMPVIWNLKKKINHDFEGPFLSKIIFLIKLYKLCCFVNLFLFYHTSFYFLYNFDMYAFYFFYIFICWDQLKILYLEFVYFHIVILFY